MGLDNAALTLVAEIERQVDWEHELGEDLKATLTLGTVLTPLSGRFEHKIRDMRRPVPA